MNAHFYHQTVRTKQIEDFLSIETGFDLNPFFNQYLRTIKIPTLEHTIANKTLKYRWTNTVANFKMPLKISIDGEEKWIYPTSNWKNLALKSAITSFLIDENFYIFGTEIK
jgi:aminopeptidase N